MSRKRIIRLAIAFLLPLAGGIALLWWRGPNWGTVSDAFSQVHWEWIVAAVGFNMLSIVVRAFAWKTAIGEALPPPHPPFRLVFAAFGVGLFGNVVLPGRVGELARVAVLTRRMPGRKVWATLIGSVVAHRVFDLFPAIALVTWVLISAKIPSWAFASLVGVVGAGVVLFAVAIVLARRHNSTALEEIGRVRSLIQRARFGLAVMRRPRAAFIAGTFQFMGWAFQLAAVWAAMRAFDIRLPIAAAGLVLVLMNVATIFPLWPGNVGLVQAAVALPLVSYGVPYGHGFAYGIGLQAIEASVGVGIGLVFLAREGFSYATLKQIPAADEAFSSSPPPAPEH